MTTIDTKKLRAAMQAQTLGPVELGRRSGVSRAHISRLLSASKNVVLRQRTLEHIARALRVKPSDLALGGQERAYMDWLIEEQGFVDFRGLGFPQLQRQPIGDVFVEPSIREEPKGREKQDGNPFESRPESPLKGLSRASRPLRASEAVLRKDRIVLLGNPGSGKTTLLRWLAQEAAKGKLLAGTLPMYVGLGELSRALEIDPATDAVRFVGRFASDGGCPHAEDLIARGLAEGRGLVLFDGLDEVAEAGHRESITEAVRAFVEANPGNRFIVTSRPHGFEATRWEGLGFCVLRVLGYGRQQFEEFAKKWSIVLRRVFDRTESVLRQSLEQAIFSNPRVRGLASNPLVLTILTLLNEARGGALPRRRVDLYAKVAEVFLDTWERTKRPSGRFDETAGIDLDAREFGWLLSDLALAMQKNDRTLAARWWVADRFQESLQGKLGFTVDEAKDASDRILRYLTDRTGLIKEEGLDQFAFWHRTLQEYFAARGIVEEADSLRTRDVTDALKGYLFHPGWREVVRLVAAQLTPPAAESLLRSILDDPDPVGRFLRRGPILSLQCLADGATVPDRGLVSGIFASLEDLGRSKWIGITLAVLEALESLSGTRHEGLATKLTNTILGIAKQELAKDEYRCLYHQVHWRAISEELERRSPQLGSDAVRELNFEVDGESVPAVFFNAGLLARSPEAWLKSISSVLQDETRGQEFRTMLIIELGRQSATHSQLRPELANLLESRDFPPSMRAECAFALGRRGSDSPLLLRTMEKEDEDIMVRAACASALATAAASDHAVRDKLLNIVMCETSAPLRRGAAQGLTRSVARDPRTAEILLGLAKRNDTLEDLKWACAAALTSQLKHSTEVANAFGDWLASSPDLKLRRIAAQALGNAMASDEIPWDRQAVERIEYVLTTLADPCPHALETLEALATVREVRRCLRLEGVLRDVFKPFRERINLVFIYGSTARKRQGPESDIDLMVIGNVTLKDVSLPLRDAERTLGRRINPALYSRDAFQQKYQAGDPFLADVYRREKIALIPSDEKDLEDELRRMVSDCELAS